MSKQEPRAAGPADGKRNDSQDEQDLTTILDTSQRADLTLLIAHVTESMRKLLTDNFDASAGLDQSLFVREGMTEDEKLMSVDPASVDVEKLDRQRKLKDEYEKNLATLKMKNLRKNSLKAFDEWRESVILRVGQVVNSERVAREQLQKGSTASKSQPQAPNTIGRITEVPNGGPNIKFKDLFPPTKTPLTKLSMEKRTLILHSILLLLLSLEHYVAPSRILLLNLTSSLKLPLKTFEQDEYTTAKGLLEVAKEMTADEETKKKAEENRDARKWKVGLATVAGAAIMGVTGSLAAPLVAAGVSSVMGGLGLGATAAAGYLGSVAGSTVLVGSLFGAYGGRMTGQMMDNYAREVEDFAFLPVHSRNKTSEDQEEGAKQASDHDHKLRVTICISGWLKEKDEVVKPWRVLGTAAEVFALKYELESLLNLGNAMDGMVKSAAWGYAQKEMIAQTMFADLAAAMWPIGLMKISRVIDNPFSVAKGRAEKAGEVLADALINKAQGERPVTLIGYSLGARVIYTCLMSLAKRKAFGLIESVVMIGAPTPSDTADWRLLRSVVSGRLVNVYSNNDYILGFMYRTSSIQYGVAGLQKVEGLSGVENVDVSDDVTGHLRYRYLVGNILKKIGFEDINMQAVEEEHHALVKMEKEEKKQSLQSQRNRLLRRQSYQGKEDENDEAEHEVSEIEKQVKASTQKSMMTRAIEYFYTPNMPSVEDVQKIAGNIQDMTKDPTKAGDAAGKTVDDVQASTESYAQWAMRKLPSMPGMSGKSPGASVQNAAKDHSKTATQVGKTATETAASTRSYTQGALQYIPGMPKSLPSMPKNLPSMPSLSSGTKTTSRPTDAAKQAADSGQAAVKTAAGVTGDVLKPTLTNLTQPQKNPAVKAAQDTKKNTPIIHQASDKIAAATPDVGLKGTKAKGESQSYVAKASSYLPSMPSMPSFGGSSGSKTGANAAAKPSPPQRQVSDIKKQAPQLDRVPSGIKSPPPKLERLSSGLKSPPAKLERLPSGLKSPPAKLERLPSGLKSPPAKLERLPSGLKSPPAKLERLPSGLKSPPAKLDRLPSGLKSPPMAAAKQVSDGGQKVLKEGGNATNKMTGKITGKLPWSGK